METALWIAQGILAATFCWSAYCKGTWDRDRLVAHGQTGVQGLSMRVIRFIALSEVLGGVGLVLPWITGTARWLTPAAAIGLGIIMVLAAVVHTRLREPRNVLANLLLLFACGFVAVGRGTAR